MQTCASWNLLVIGMVGTKVVKTSAKYFCACFELLTKCGWILPLYRQALAKTVAPKYYFTAAPVLFCKSGQTLMFVGVISCHQAWLIYQNNTNSQWSLFFIDLDELLSEYELHRSRNDIAITENLTIRLENAVWALQNVSHFVSQTNKEAVLEMARNFQFMFWNCHRRCEFPSGTRCSQVAVLSLLKFTKEWIPGRLEGQNLTSKKRH